MSDLPFVSFVGAGPGEAELITLKGLRRIRDAAVIIHDPLVSAELLAQSGSDAEVIDAGKGPGRHGLGQPEINRLLVDRARRRGRVVRLEGGDPGVFARLADEVGAVGVDALGPITATLTALGRDGRQPALIVERCGLPDERIVAARLGEVAERARQAGIEPPAVLVTGPTVSVASAPVRRGRRVRSVDDHGPALAPLQGAMVPEA